MSLYKKRVVKRLEAIMESNKREIRSIGYSNMRKTEKLIEYNKKLDKTINSLKGVEA
jgi:hypothetical protein